MAAKSRNTFYENEKQETTENRGTKDFGLERLDSVNISGRAPHLFTVCPCRFEDHVVNCLFDAVGLEFAVGPACDLSNASVARGMVDTMVAGGCPELYYEYYHYQDMQHLCPLRHEYGKYIIYLK
ncbi:hypothetical protein AAG570_001722 [Ranatra chinensis]|uniref:Uncharacterized protein n=1 Tax=Ranatra chinensis TaxID=642074 RepID=A0ABD0YND6_9HEMI